MKIVILAGGNGTRLWPISREHCPKQFNKLDSLGGESLFQQSLKRALYLTDKDNIYIVVSKDNFFHAEIQAEELGINIGKDKFIFQPSMKETLPIIALSVSKIGFDEKILFLPSDQVIEDLDLFKKRIDLGLINSDKGIILFGIKATRPETGYGYIEKEEKDRIFSKVKKFHEKPNKELAEKYIKDGFLWNAGMFLFESNKFIDLLDEVNPIMKKIIFDTNIDDKTKFDKVEAISIDNGLIEKIDNVYCVSLDNYWTDLGSFDSIDQYSSDKKVKQNNIVNEGKSKNNFVLTETQNKEVCLIDVEDLIVIDSEDVLLISKKGSTQKVKTLVKNTKKLIGNLEYRPWGSYKIINEGRGFKTKRLTILPGKKTSLQSHNHRSEHWVIAEGTAKIYKGKNIELVSKGESIYVSIGEIHRIENPGLIPLIIIETQIGDYLGEDDIERYEDDYGRI